MNIYKTRNGIAVTADWLNQCEIDGMSESQIAEALDMTRMGLWKIRGKLNCPQARRSDRGKERKPSDEKHQLRLKYMREYNHTHKRGVKVVRIGNRILAESRYIVEQVIGRRLEKNEIVHHIDGNPKNNAKSNLLLCDPSYHRYLHNAMRFGRERAILF